MKYLQKKKVHFLVMFPLSYARLDATNLVVWTREHVYVRCVRYRFLVDISFFFQCVASFKFRNLARFVVIPTSMYSSVVVSHRTWCIFNSFGSPRKLNDFHRCEREFSAISFCSLTFSNKRMNIGGVFNVCNIYGKFTTSNVFFTYTLFFSISLLQCESSFNLWILQWKK